ncbi:MAG: ATP-binding protein, partial [Nocardioides sp.]|uniref:AAA family ATPase n=1 Tax=Nocardioides sp. TaxID=35761 RepID=UPI0039E39C5F
MPRMGALAERDREVEVLRRLLEDAVAGRGRVVHLIGEAGIGKTALVRLAAAEAEREGIEVLLASPGQTDRQVPFGVVRQLLTRPLMALAHPLRAATWAQVSAGPGRRAAAHLVGADEAEALDQSTMIASLAWLVEDLAAERPLLLVVDDAQWADEDSLRFLSSLARSIAGQPVLVLVAARPVAPSHRGPALAELLADRD